MFHFLVGGAAAVCFLSLCLCRVGGGLKKPVASRAGVGDPADCVRNFYGRYVIFYFFFLPGRKGGGLVCPKGFSVFYLLNVVIFACFVWILIKCSLYLHSRSM